jgi:hypothetical protein
MNACTNKRKHRQECQSPAKEEEVTESHSRSEEWPRSRKKRRIDERRGGEKLKTPQSIENAVIRQRGDELIVTTKV